VVIKYRLPLMEVITSFYDQLKSNSSGYARRESLQIDGFTLLLIFFCSFDYEDAGYEESDMVKVTMLLNHVPVGSLSIITHRSKSYFQGLFSILLYMWFVLTLNPFRQSFGAKTEGSH